MMARRLAVSTLAAVSTAASVAACSTPTTTRNVPSARGATSSAAATTAITSTATSGPGTSASVRSAVLRASDFPGGWRTVPPPSDRSTPRTVAAELATCTGSRDTAPDRVAEEVSDSFVRGNMQVASSAAQFRSHQDVLTGVAELHSPKIDRCLAEALRAPAVRALPPGVTVGPVSVHVTTGSQGGPSNVVATANGRVTVSSQGSRANLYFRLGFVAGTLVLTTVTAQSLGTALAGSELSPLLQNVSARVH